MIDERYMWFVWSAAFLVPWLILYWLCRKQRRVMLWASLFTMPFGLSEPLFVPAYWAPPSLFDLALRTGFDLESLIFCFGIGGVAAVLFDLIAGTAPQSVPGAERHHRRRRFHRWALRGAGACCQASRMIRRHSKGRDSSSPADRSSPGLLTASLVQVHCTSGG